VSGNGPEDEEVGQNVNQIYRLELAGERIANHSWLNSSSTSKTRRKEGFPLSQLGPAGSRATNAVVRDCRDRAAWRRGICATQAK
jgi:hypothetical protein